MKTLPSSPRSLATAVLLATFAGSAGLGCDGAGGGLGGVAGGSSGLDDGQRLPSIETGATMDDVMAPITAVAAADDGCPVASIATWTGTAMSRESGSGSSDEMRAEVTWTRVASEGCVDRYVPSGTAVWDFQIGCCCDLSYAPGEHTIAQTDGELVIDRSASPAQYAVRGETRWETQESCAVSPDDDGGPSAGTGGGIWLDRSGTIGPAGIAGALEEDHAAASWSFAAGGV